MAQKKRIDNPLKIGTQSCILHVYNLYIITIIKFVHILGCKQLQIHNVQVIDDEFTASLFKNCFYHNKQNRLSRTKIFNICPA